MSKNSINFKAMDLNTRLNLLAFKQTALVLAEEDINYRAKLKPLKTRLESIYENRKIAIENGLTIDEATSEYSVIEVEREINRLKTIHDEETKRLRGTMSNTYQIIPITMYDSYTKKINEQKRGDFLNDIKTFLENIGIDNCRQGQISKFAETMSDMIGAKYATSKQITTTGMLHTTMSKSQFNKLFLAVFCDMFIND